MASPDLAERPVKVRRLVSYPEAWVLTALSAVLHGWRLFTPRAVVFDELYYERFAGYYLTGRYMFDVHPPLGRMMFAGLAHLFGMRPESLDIPLPAVELRLLPALFGVVLIPLVFGVLRQLGASRRVATLGAGAVALDNALLVMSRLILPDILLIVFGLGSVSAYLAARPRSGAGRWAFIVLAALLAGCGFSVKWTGASGLGVVLSIWLYDAWHRRAAWRRPLAEGVLLVAIPAVVYLTAWAAHFAILSHSGPGDAFMTVRFRAQLPGTVQYNPAAPRLSYWEKLGEVHHAIRYGNGALEHLKHPGSSPWYTWPIMKHPIGLWEAANLRPGYKSMVVLIGNPVVWWFGLLATGLGAVLFGLRRARFAGHEFGFAVLVGAVLLNFVPFMAIKRLMYIYHYLFALVLLAALGAFSLGIASDWMSRDDAPWRLRRTRSDAVYVAVFVIIIAGFLYFAPMTYAYPLSTRSWDAHFWILHPTF